MNNSSIIYQVDLVNHSQYENSADATTELELLHGASAGNPRVVYQVTSPSLFDDAVQGLLHSGLIPPPEQKVQLRVVVEKPFGHDLQSAKELNHTLMR